VFEGESDSNPRIISEYFDFHGKSSLQGDFNVKRVQTPSGFVLRTKRPQNKETGRKTGKNKPLFSQMAFPDCAMMTKDQRTGSVQGRVREIYHTGIIKKKVSRDFC